MIHIVFSKAQIKIYYTDRNHLLDLCIIDTLWQVLYHALGNAVEDPLEVVILPVCLDFDDHQDTGPVFHQQVRSGQMLLPGIFVALAFKHLQNHSSALAERGQ